MKKMIREKFKTETLIYDDDKMQQYMTEVGQRIYRERVKKGLSIASLAELSNLSCSCICKVESAQVEVSLKALLKLAVALEVPVSAFLDDGGEGQKVSHTALVNMQRFESLVGRTEEEVVDAVLGMADGFMQALDKSAERGVKTHVR